uniref:Uncharacterized protein n=1 Tax=Falco tinnunculus TaxID=100819 RepID=A0A8C4U6H9_FALTI
VKRNGSRSRLIRSRFGSRERDWLKEDVGRGCVYLYGKDSAATASSDLSYCSYTPLLCFMLQMF